MKKLSLIFIFICLITILASCDRECRHDNMSESKLDPTCTEDGHVKYTCDDCGYTYLDMIIEPLGHSFEKNVIPADCTHDGYTEYVCSCGYSYISDYISADGHDYVNTFKSADCEEGGYTTHTCKNCDYSYISNHTDPTSHEFSSDVLKATCTEQGYTRYYCVKCQKEYKADFTDPSGHEYTKEILSSASCTEKGEVKFTCTHCDHSYSLITSPYGHDFSRVVMMPTLSDMGYTEFTCKNDNCGFTYTGELRFYSDILKDAFADNTTVLAKGIDISHHQYSIDPNGYVTLDWDAIKAAGVEYVIIRAAEASIGIDPTFEKSYTDAKAAGLDVGVYFYTMATSVDEIRREAYLVLSALEGKQFEYPIYLDLEDESLMGIDPAILNEMCVEFFTILQRSGYYTGLYVNHEWLYNLIDKDNALTRFEIWYARYPALSEGEEYTWNVEENGEHLGMWQYTDSGVIEGVDTIFDFNFAYKDYPTLIKEGGFNGYDSDVKFPDTDKSFVWVIHSGDIKVRNKSDYFVNDEYDPGHDIVGYAKSGERFEVVEKNEKYTAIMYNGEVAYISANPQYVSFTGIYPS